MFKRQGCLSLSLSFFSSQILAPTPPPFVSLPPYSLVKQTIWDMSLINTINDAWLPRELTATAGGTSVNK